jgi:DedD protein
MGLLSFFRREPASQASVGTSVPRKRGSKAVQADPAEQVQLLRQRARHRLIGAAVLVGVGIVAFPLVFETQPRPVPMDLPIVIPSHERAPAFTPTAPVPASLPEAARAQVEPPVSTEPARAAVDEPPAVADEEAPAAPITKPIPAADKPAAPSARYVVQVGAFADKKAAQDARDRLERKGLKTYAQVAQTKDGPRIRVRLGPFTSKTDAEKAASTAQSLGLAGKVLTL